MIKDTVSNTELENLCTKILELKGVMVATFFNRDGTLLCWKTKVKPLISRADAEDFAFTRIQIVHEMIVDLSEYVGPLELIAFHHKYRNAFLIPFKEIFLIFTTEKVAQDPIIKKVKKIIKGINA